MGKATLLAAFLLGSTSYAIADDYLFVGEALPRHLENRITQQDPTLQLASAEVPDSFFISAVKLWPTASPIKVCFFDGSAALRAAVAKAEGEKRAMELKAEGELFTAQKVAEAKRIQADADARQAEAEARLSAQAAEAEASIRATRDQALSQVREIATDTAVAVVARLLGTQPDGASIDQAVGEDLSRRGVK